MRLIDADALEAKLEEQRKLYIEMDMKGAEHLLVHDVLHYVWEAPTIDPVRHGRWESHTDRYICPICRREWCFIDNDVDMFSYCPHCGAKMDI